MKAAILEDLHAPITVKDTDYPSTKTKSELVVLHAAALNHRDVWITKGKYPGIKLPVILGSDGTGICDGQNVLIEPGFSWGDDQSFQSTKYNILGLPKNGTFAQMVAVPQQNVFPKPEFLSWYGAAALPLAGITAYRALFYKGQVKKGDHVLITGIGGGVALFALQFALAQEAIVYVTSGSDSKIQSAESMGAAGGANYQENGWAKRIKEISGGIDLVIDGAGGPGFGDLIKICNPGASVVSYGGTAGKVSFLPQLLFWKQVNVLGSTMGSPLDFQNMLNFVNHHKIDPVIDSVFKLADINKAMERMKSGTQFGKIVINLQNA